jgi:hypothetical protein
MIFFVFKFSMIWCAAVLNVLAEAEAEASCLPIGHQSFMKNQQNHKLNMCMATARCQHKNSLRQLHTKNTTL